MNCPISAGGRVMAALAPYFETFHRIQDVVPQCGDSFGISVIPVQLDLDEQIELCVGNNFADDGGLSTSGHVTVLELTEPGP